MSDSMYSNPSRLYSPIEAAPNGVTPNFVNPPSKTYQIYVAAGVCIVLVLIFATLRLWTRFRILHRYLKIHECVFMAAVITTLAHLALVIANTAVTRYIGFHAYDLEQTTLTKTFELTSLLLDAFYAFALLFVKLSVFLMYLELFSTIKWLRTCVWVGMSLDIAVNAASMIPYTYLCSPSHGGTSQVDYIAAFYSTQCQNAKYVIWTRSVFNVVSDLYLLILPLPIIIALQTPQSKKLGILMMFLTGVYTLASSILGLVYRSENLSNTHKYNDIPWNEVNVLITSTTELTAGIMLSSMPSLLVFIICHKDPLLSRVYTILRKERVIGTKGSWPRNSSLDRIDVDKMTQVSRTQMIRQSQNTLYQGPPQIDAEVFISHDSSASVLQNVEGTIHDGIKVTTETEIHVHPNCDPEKGI